MKNKASIAGLTIGIVALLGIGAQAVYATSYTSSQVAQHNTTSDCWEVINGKVYNLTEFIPLHSGGQSIIVAQCGKDATAVFNSGPHSASTLNALSGYLLGDLSVAPAVTPTPPATTTGTSTPSQEPIIPVVTAPTQTSPEFVTTRDDDEDEGEDENRRANVSETRHAKKERVSTTGRISFEQEDRDDSSGEDD